jgi:hypothetical protein
MEGMCRISGRTKQNDDFANFENKCQETMTRGMEAMGMRHADVISAISGSVGNSSSEGSRVISHV